MSVTEKVWGTTEALIVTPMFEMHRLVIKPNMRCSLHVHQFKWNAFYVLEGVVCIDFDDGTRRLESNKYATVSPGVYHQFRTGLEPCTALEMYYTEPLSEDIIRRTVGGPVTMTKLPEGRYRYPMHTLIQARYSYLLLLRDYRDGEIDAGTYKEAKARLYARWPDLKPEAWR